MDKRLLTLAIVKFLLGFILVSLSLFIPAGTINYWNAWLFLGILFIPVLIMGIVLMLKNPELLQKRLHSKEKESEQKSIIKMKTEIKDKQLDKKLKNYLILFNVSQKWTVWGKKLRDTFVT